MSKCHDIHRSHALVGVTAFSSIVAPGGWFFGHCDNVTVYTEYIASMSPRRGVLFLWRFRHWPHRRFSLWKYPGRPVARVWHWNDGVCVSANDVWAFDEITHTDTWTNTPLYYEVAILWLIPYVFHFKCVSYKYYIDFCVFKSMLRFVITWCLICWGLVQVDFSQTTHGNVLDTGAVLSSSLFSVEHPWNIWLRKLWLICRIPPISNCDNQNQHKAN